MSVHDLWHFCVQFVTPFFVCQVMTCLYMNNDTLCTICDTFLMSSMTLLCTMCYTFGICIRKVHGRFLCIHMYVCIFICMYVYSYVCMYIHMYVCVAGVDWRPHRKNTRSLFIYIYIYIYTYTYAHTYTHIHMHTHIHIHMHIHSHLHTHMHIYLHLCIRYVCIYTYT
jgi:hypothetical protein